MTTPTPTMLTQPGFAGQLTTKAFPLTNGPGGGTSIQTGFMQWAPPYIYGSTPAVIRYQYNPSTVASDYNIASASAQAAYDFPNPGDAAALAIPLSQTVQWSLMYDRTFELWGNYDATGTPAGNGTASTLDASQIGCQVDVIAFMQFTGMLDANQFTTNGQGGLTAAAAYSTSQTGIMQMIPAYAYFGSSSTSNQLMYYGYINEWSVQYTHFTQYNIPMRCVISVNFTMLPSPAGTGAAGAITGSALGVSIPTATNTIPGVTSPLTGAG